MLAQKRPVVFAAVVVSLTCLAVLQKGSNHRENAGFRYRQSDINLRKVLIVGYPRGGSSFFGELFGKNVNVTYVYEPLFTIYHTLYGAPVLKSVDITVTPYKSIRTMPKNEKEMVTKTIVDIFRCDFSQLPVQSILLLFTSKSHYLYDHFCWAQVHSKLEPCLDLLPKWCYLYAGAKLLSYCQRLVQMNISLGQFKSFLKTTRLKEKDRSFLFDVKARYLQCTKTPTIWIDRCRRLLESRCKIKQIRVIKVVRLHADAFEDLMKQIPNLELIHYARDPRGIVSSRQKLNLTSRTSITEEISDLCTQMLYDLRKLSFLQTNYSSRILTVKYEDLSEFPERTMTKVYKRLGLKIPKEVLFWLQFSTSSVGVTEKAFSTSRLNSNSTAYDWLNHFNSSQLIAMTTPCLSVLRLFRYRYHVTLPPGISVS